MPTPISSAIEPIVGRVRATSVRLVTLGTAAVVGILALAAVLLFAALPDADAFDRRVERLFLESESLPAPQEIRLLEILAQSGTAFADVLSGYRAVIFVLLIFATMLLVACVAFLVALVALNRRMGEIERSGIQVTSLVLSRADNTVMLNDLELKLTDAAMETLSVLAEARLDGDMLSGAQIEAMITGRRAEECDEASGATRIKRLRDALGNQLVTALLIRNVTRQGYVLTLDPKVIRMV